MSDGTNNSAVTLVINTERAVYVSMKSGFRWRSYRFSVTFRPSMKQ